MLLTLSMKLWIFLLRSVMPTDLTLVLRKSANWAETAFASGGSDGRSALVGDRALASSSGMSRLWISQRIKYWFMTRFWISQSNTGSTS